MTYVLAFAVSFRGDKARSAYSCPSPLDLRANAKQTTTRVSAAPTQKMSLDELNRIIKELEKQMKEAAQQLEFEKAALLRDQIFELRQTLVETDKSIPEWQKAQRLAEMEH